MRVLYIINYFPPHRTGGGEVAAFNSCLGMRRRGVECAVLCIHTRRPSVERTYRISGVPVRQVYRQEWRRRAWRDVFTPWVYRLVSDEICRFKPDLIHTHNVSGVSLAPFVASQRLGVPVVATLHDHWLLCANNMLYQKDGSPCDPSSAGGVRRCNRCLRQFDFWGNIPYRRKVFSTLTRHVREFLVPSQYLIEQHVRAGYRRERFRLVRLGVPMEVSPEPMFPLALEEVFNGVGRDRALLFAGGLNIIKGVHVLIAALPELIQHVEGLRLIVAGAKDRIFAAQLREFGQSVRLLGSVSFRQMHALYSAADLTTVPSTCQENFPLVAAESVAMGTPVVGTALGGIAEIVREGETGYLVPPGDPQALAERVIEHFSRPAFWRREMRRRCAQWGQELVSFEKHLDLLSDVYSSAV